MVEYMGHHLVTFCNINKFSEDVTITVYFEFLLWDDGGKVWGLRNGLFSAIKGWYCIINFHFS